jgi:DNA end-binding protein Ku
MPKNHNILLCVLRNQVFAMAPRSGWKGYLKLSLVSAPIAIYPSTSSAEKVRINTFNHATGKRLKRPIVDCVTSDIVENEDTDTGYGAAKDRGDDNAPAEILIEIEQFAPKASVDDRYRETPLYLAPEDEVGHEAFAVIRDAMKKKKMVGIARVVMASRERFMMLEPIGKGIISTLLHYPYDIHRDEAVFEEIPDLKLPDQMIGLAEDIIDRMSGEFAPEKFRYRDESATIEFIHAIQADVPAKKEKPAPPLANDLGLIDEFRRSIEVVQRARRAPRRPKRPERR